MSLKADIDRLAAELVDAILEAVKGASFEEITGWAGTPKRGPGRPKKANGAKTAGKRVRRTAAEIQAEAKRVAAALKKHPKGLRSEQIRAELKVEKKDLPRVLKEALALKLVKSSGQKRATTYKAI